MLIDVAEPAESQDLTSPEPSLIVRPSADALLAKQAVVRVSSLRG